MIRIKKAHKLKTFSVGGKKGTVFISGPSADSVHAAAREIEEFSMKDEERLQITAIKEKELLGSDCPVPHNMRVRSGAWFYLDKVNIIHIIGTIIFIFLFFFPPSKRVVHLCSSKFPFRSLSLPHMC